MKTNWIVPAPSKVNQRRQAGDFMSDLLVSWLAQETGVAKSEHSVHQARGLSACIPAKSQQQTQRCV
jgi:hypothetical protein